MRYTESELKKAHNYSFESRKELERAKKAGCFFCCRTFSPNEVVEWADNDKTAICPYCGVDSVISDASGYPMNQDFLTQMRDYWFENKQ